MRVLFLQQQPCVRALKYAVGLAGRGREVFSQRYGFNSSVKSEPAFVTPIFELPEGNVRVEVDTDLANDWAFFAFALINDDTGTAYDFGRDRRLRRRRDRPFLRRERHLPADARGRAGRGLRDRRPDRRRGLLGNASLGEHRGVPLLRWRTAATAHALSRRPCGGAGARP